MDVKCDKCGTEYEFDDGRVGAHGVTVKCTACGYVFKVHRPRPGGEAGREWLVRRPDGQIIAFRELTTLQKWIVEGRIGREDEISKNGETWKRLGNIAELEPFFTVYEKARALNDLMVTGAIGERPITINGSEVLATMSPLAPSSLAPAGAQLPPAPSPPPNIEPAEFLGATGVASIPPAARRSGVTAASRLPARGAADRLRPPSLVMRSRAGELDDGPPPVPSAISNVGSATIPEGEFGESPTQAGARNLPGFVQDDAMHPSVMTPTEPPGPPSAPPPSRSNGARAAATDAAFSAAVTSKPPASGPKPPARPASAPAKPASKPALIAQDIGEVPINPDLTGSSKRLDLAGPAALDRRSIEPPALGTDVDIAGRSESSGGDEVVRRFQRERRVRRVLAWTAALVAIGLAGGGAFAIYGPQTNFLRQLLAKSGILPASMGRDPVLNHVEQAHAELERDTLESLAIADTELKSALELKPHDPALMADRALVLSTTADALRRWAVEQEVAATAYDKRVKDWEIQMERFKAVPPGELVRAPEKPPAIDVDALKKDAQKKRAEASAMMKQAFELARVAYQTDKTLLQTPRALADYYRVQRDEQGRMNPLLERAKAAAQAMGTTDWATIYIEAASIVRDPDEAQPAALEKASRLLEEALTLRPTLHRARVLLARILLARKLPALAKTELERVLAASPKHEEAKRLLARATAGAASSSAPIAAPTGAAGATGAAATAAAGATGAAAPTGAAAATGAAAPTGAVAATGASDPSAPSGAPAPTGGAAATGAPAPTGAVAATGAIAATGATAPTGAAGASGATGTTGAEERKDPATLVREGDRLREAGKPGKALLAYERAAEQGSHKPAMAKAFTGMGWSYLDLGKPHAALTQFRRASQMDQRFAEAHFGRAEAFRALGQTANAIEAYRLYLQLEPSGTESIAARRAIESLEKEQDGQAPPP